MPLLWARVGAPLVLAFCGLCVAIAGLDVVGLAMAAVAAAAWRWARGLPHPAAVPALGPDDAVGHAERPGRPVPAALGPDHAAPSPDAPDHPGAAPMSADGHRSA